MLNTFSFKKQQGYFNVAGVHEMSTNPQTTFSMHFVPTCTYTQITRNDKMAKNMDLK